MEMPKRQFASDNCAGICPAAWALTIEANSGHVAAYGEDSWTHRASDLMRELFEIWLCCDNIYARITTDIVDFPVSRHGGRVDFPRIRLQSLFVNNFAVARVHAIGDTTAPAFDVVKVTVVINGR